MLETNDKLDRLYRLLPAIHRIRDGEQGYPLRALLQVIAEQVNLVEEDIQRMYDNWFIETCEDWVVPYIGDLVGYRQVHEAGEPSAPSTQSARARNKILIPRRDVADSIRNRRRKGTLALLEELAADVAGWPARAVEFSGLTAMASSLHGGMPARRASVDLREMEALDLLNGPFDRLPHSVDVRGRYNLPNLGLFVWRMSVFSATNTPPQCVESAGAHCYTFNILGIDMPLMNRPRPETDPTQIAGETNLPTPIRRRAFEARLHEYYGDGKSLVIYEGKRKAKAPDKAVGKKGKPEAEIVFSPIPSERILPADLSGWAYLPPDGHVAVDPVLGRFAFPLNQLPKEGIKVSYHYGAPMAIGGGEYDRELAQPTEHVLYQVGGAGPYRTINDALAKWDSDLEKNAGTPESMRVRFQNAVIEILDSDVYSEALNLRIGEKQSLQLRAANRARPVIHLLDRNPAAPDSLRVMGEAGSRFTLDGILVYGRGMRLEGDLAEVVIRHSTLVPGWGLKPDCEPARSNEASLVVSSPNLHLRIEQSILGTIEVVPELPEPPHGKSASVPEKELQKAGCQGIAGEFRLDPICIHLKDSILDATHPDLEALGAPGCPVAHAVLTIERCTVIGSVQAHAIQLGQDTIFDGKVFVARSQIGCLRFCYVTPGSRTPRRFHCEPDLTLQRAEQDLRDAAKAAPSPILPAALDADIEVARTRESERLTPHFESKRYGSSGYCRLPLDAPEEIERGAEDGAEMGVHHDLYFPQRVVNLRARFDEYVPAGTVAGIIFAN
ncbi:MAG: hypothetical protein SF339_17145 [Blastocatellia bacterium]|nr:hypothetical protein [Blastocatellia bacterium]